MAWKEFHTILVALKLFVDSQLEWYNRIRRTEE